MKPIAPTAAPPAPPIAPTTTAPPKAPPASAPDVTHLLDGTAYRATGLLGKGAQGLVVDAEHVALGKPVVIKVLHEKHSLDPRQVERIRLEAQALARLSSAHLVAVSDLGALPDGRPFFAMEKLWGRTLKTEGWEHGPFSPADAIAVAVQVLAALAVVHRAGLVHRDVKPENVFLCELHTPGPPLVKLLDFGIAKVLPSVYGSVVSAPAPTAANIAVGTPRFLSPEQACAAAVDARSDLYAVGVLLFWMLTGRDPFAHHQTMLDILLAHVTEPAPAPSVFTPAPLPPALEAAITRALQKLPAQRFASAEDFAAALGAVRLDVPVLPPPGGGTVRMVPPGREAPHPPPEAPPAGGGTIRMDASPGGRGAARAPGPRAWPLGPAARAQARRWFRQARRVLPSLSFVGLVALSAAGVTVVLLLAARVAGLLR